MFEKVLDQQLRKLGHAICSSFTTEHTTLYLQRRNRRVENLVGLFLLLDSQLPPDTPVSWQYCLSSDLTTQLQLQGLLNVRDEPPQRESRSYEHLPYPHHPARGAGRAGGRGGVGFLSPTGSLTTVAGGEERKGTGVGNSGNASSSSISSGPAYLEGQSSAIKRSPLPSHCQGQSPLLNQSQGTGGGPVQQLSLMTDLTLTPPQLPVTPGDAAPTTSSRFAAAFFGLPLSLLHLPPSPSQMTLLPVPITASFRGYESLAIIMKRILEALQQAVYHVLLTNSFYRRIFDMLVPEAASVAAGWTKSPSWQQPPATAATAAARTPTEQTAASQATAAVVDLPSAWSQTPSPPAPPASHLSQSKGVAVAVAVAGVDAAARDDTSTTSAAQCPPSADSHSSISDRMPAAAVSAKEDNVQCGTSQLSASSSSPVCGVASKQLFFSSPSTGTTTIEYVTLAEQQQMAQEDNNRLSQAVCSEEAHTVYPNPVLRGEGLLCYPSSLQSPCRTQDSAVSHSDSDGYIGDDGARDDDGDDEGDSMRTTKKGGVRSASASTTASVSLPRGEGSAASLSHRSEGTLSPSQVMLDKEKHKTKTTSPQGQDKDKEQTVDPVLAGSVASECPNQKLYMLQHPPTFALEHLIPVGLKLLISFSKNDLLVQGTQAMCSFDIEIETKLPSDGGGGGSGREGGGESEGDGVDDHGGEEEDGEEDGSVATQGSPPQDEEDNDMPERNGNSSFVSNAVHLNKSCARNTRTRSSTTATTLVNVPGALAFFSFDPSDVTMGASKIREASFDLDVNAAALSFLDHVQILHDYFGNALSENIEEEERDDGEGCNDDGSGGGEDGDSMTNNGDTDRNGLVCEEVSTI